MAPSRAPRHLPNESRSCLDRLAQHADVLVTRGQGDRLGQTTKRKEPEEETAPLSP